MEELDDIKNVFDYLGGGWLSLVLVVLLGLMVGYLKYAEKKAKRERAQKETDQNRAKDQAGTSEQNQTAQEKWDEGMSEIDKIREDVRRPKDDGGET